MKQDTGVTFREQFDIWLRQLQNRRRKPIRKSYEVKIQGALDKWILPAIGNLPPADVDILSVKPLVRHGSVAAAAWDINNFWLAHKPQIMSEVYSHLHGELQLRLDEAEQSATDSVFQRVQM